MPDVTFKLLPVRLKFSPLPAPVALPATEIKELALIVIFKGAINDTPLELPVDLPLK